MVLLNHILINNESCELAIPTAFSPNNSNTNDEFRAIKNCDVSSFTMNIYNRWGELIFTSEDIKIGWDGYYKDQKASLGVYSWNIEYSLINESELKTDKGTITLIQ